MYLVDTNVISEVRKRSNANKGVRAFFKQAIAEQSPMFISVVTVSELRRGVELIRHRGDTRQAKQLEKWLEALLAEYQAALLDINPDIAQLWGRLRVPHPENALDKLIAATALIYDLTVVTRNHKDFERTGVRLLNPFDDGRRIIDKSWPIAAIRAAIDNPRPAGPQTPATAVDNLGGISPDWCE